MKYDVFVSYRRKEGYETAKIITNSLINDGYTVSFDQDNLRSGSFDSQLLERIEECTDFIIILNKTIFSRCLKPDNNPKDDWLRQELKHAITKKKNIIPVMLQGFVFPKDLPSDIAAISMHNAIPYSGGIYANAFHEILTDRFMKSDTIKFSLKKTLRNNGIYNIIHGTMEPHYAEQFFHQSLNLKIIGLSSNSLIKKIKEQIIDILIRGGKIEILSGAPDSQFIKEVELMESIHRVNRISSEIEDVKAHLLEFHEEAVARNPRSMGSIELKYYSTHLRAAIVLCDNAGWYTINLPPQRSVEALSLEFTVGKFYDTCNRHFKGIWEQSGERILNLK